MGVLNQNETPLYIRIRYTLPSRFAAMPETLKKVNLASRKLLLRSSTRGLSLLLNNIVILLIDSTHGLPLVPTLAI
ncbi:hypothetical protein Hdeb2414_s0003g00111121 [Helianthus debilis subsp. tardiflorus]